MDTALIAQICSDVAVTALAGNDGSLRQSKARTGTRALDDDYGCRQRNSPPLLDRRLIPSCRRFGKLT